MHLLKLFDFLASIYNTYTTAKTDLTAAYSTGVLADSAAISAADSTADSSADSIADSSADSSADSIADSAADSTADTFSIYKTLKVTVSALLAVTPWPADL